MRIERIVKGFAVVAMTVLVVCVMLVCAGGCRTTYTRRAEVYSTARHSNTPYRTTEFVDDDGNIWAFNDDFDFNPDAAYELTLDNNGTQDIGDDVIVLIKKIETDGD